MVLGILSFYTVFVLVIGLSVYLFNLIKIEWKEGEVLKTIILTTCLWLLPIIYIFISKSILALLWFLGYDIDSAEIIKNKIIISIFASIVHSPKLLTISVLFKLTVWCLEYLLYLANINSIYLGIIIFIYIIFAFILSEDKIQFLTNIIFIMIFWNSLGLLINQLFEYSSYKGGKILKADSMDNGSSATPGGGGFNSQGEGSNPQGGGPNPPGDGSGSALAAGGAGLEKIKGDSKDRGWSKAGSSTGYDYGSDGYVSSDEFSEYNSEDNTYDRGMEKNGFIKKSHQIIYTVMEARIKSLELAKAKHPDHIIDKTGLKGQSNIIHQPKLADLQAHPLAWQKTADHLNNYVFKDSGFIKFKPEDNTQEIDGYSLVGTARLEVKGAALYLDKSSKWKSLTNNKLKNVVKVQWDKDFSSSGSPYNR